LRDAIASLDLKRVAAVIDEDDLHLASIIGIDGTRRIQDSYSSAQSNTAARPHLPLEAEWNCYRDARRHQRSVSSLQDNRCTDVGAEVESR
jgi:hypothetical protein